MPKTKSVPGAVKKAVTDFVALLSDDRAISLDEDDSKAWAADVEAFVSGAMFENREQGVATLRELMAQVNQISDQKGEAKPLITEEQRKKEYADGADFYEQMHNALSAPSPDGLVGNAALFATILLKGKSESSPDELRIIGNWKTAVQNMQRYMSPTNVSGDPAIHLSTLPADEPPRPKWQDQKKEQSPSRYKDAIFEQYLKQLPALQQEGAAFAKAAHEAKDETKALFIERSRAEYAMLASVSPHLPPEVQAGEKRVQEARDKLREIQKSKTPVTEDVKKAAENNVKEAEDAYVKTCHAVAGDLADVMKRQTQGVQNAALKAYLNQLAETYAYALVSGQGAKFKQQRKKHPTMLEFHQEEQDSEKFRNSITKSACEKRKKDNKKECEVHPERCGIQPDGKQWPSLWIYFGQGKPDGKEGPCISFEESRASLWWSVLGVGVGGLSNQGINDVSEAARRSWDLVKSPDCRDLKTREAVEIFLLEGLKRGKVLPPDKYPTGAFGRELYPDLKNVGKAYQEMQSEMGGAPACPTMAQLWLHMRTHEDDKGNKVYAGDVGTLVGVVGGPKRESRGDEEGMPNNLKALVEMSIDIFRSTTDENKRKTLMEEFKNNVGEKYGKAIAVKVSEEAQKQIKEEEAAINEEVAGEAAKAGAAVTLSTGDSSGAAISLSTTPPGSGPALLVNTGGPSDPLADADAPLDEDAEGAEDEDEATESNGTVLPPAIRVHS